MYLTGKTHNLEMWSSIAVCSRVAFFLSVHGNVLFQAKIGLYCKSSHDHNEVEPGTIHVQ